MREPLLSCKAISMNFGITKALVDVDFTLMRGKICGLVGENGSGKSTLSSIIAGIYSATSGSMQFKGKAWQPKNTLEASKCGIGIIVQEAGTVPLISVGANIFIGQEARFCKFGMVDNKKMNAAANKVLSDINARYVHAEEPCYKLNMQDRKVVEIAKAYNNIPELLIVDETTNVLSHNGREILFELIHKLAAEDKSVLIISHDIDEVMEHCDQIAILKDGRLVSTLEKSEFGIDKIKSLMIGRELQGNYYRNDNDGYSDEVVLSVNNVTALNEVTNVSFDVHKGEILGIGGLSDCGMHVLGKVLFGEELIAKGSVVLKHRAKCTNDSIGRKSKKSKNIKIDNALQCWENGDVLIDNAETAVKNGIAYISKDRDRESLALDASISDNIASTGFDKNLIANIFVSSFKENAYVDNQVNALKIKCNSKNEIVRSLSGGNKQKVAFGKWFAKDSDIFIMDCPTRGIDIGVKQEIYRIIYEMKKQGKSIIIISEELSELIGMSDRLLVMKNGGISKELFRSDSLTEKDVIDYMI